MNFYFKIWLKPAARILLVFMLLLMPWATLTPDPGTPAGAAPLLHLGGMAWVAFLACLSFDSLRSRAWAVILVFAYSALMEYFQNLLPYRNGNWEDVGINAMGCLLGTGIFMILNSLLATFQGPGYTRRL